jgi:hypothetical protein
MVASKTNGARRNGQPASGPASIGLWASRRAVAGLRLRRHSDRTDGLRLDRDHESRIGGRVVGGGHVGPSFARASRGACHPDLLAGDGTECLQARRSAEPRRRLIRQDRPLARTGPAFAPSRDHGPQLPGRGPPPRDRARPHCGRGLPLGGLASTLADPAQPAAEHRRRGRTSPFRLRDHGSRHPDRARLRLDPARQQPGPCPQPRHSSFSPRRPCPALPSRVKIPLRERGRQDSNLRPSA